MKLLNKILSSISIFALLFMQMAAPLAVLAQEASSSSEVTEVIESPTPTVSPTPTETPAPSPTSIPSPIPVIESDSVAISVIEPTSTSSQWTFEKVELNKEYTAPQNSGIKLTFTKLPTPAGNIKIEEITLTKEQIQQTGSLSDKAYDITSDMVDGSFNYNLSLPIPESSKGKEVSVKFAEELSNIGSAEKVENTLIKTDTSVSVTSLDHFTIFVVVSPNPAGNSATSNDACLTSVVGGSVTCYDTIQAAIDVANPAGGDTINFTSDITATATVVVNRAVTINGGGFTLSFTGLEGPEAIPGVDDGLLIQAPTTINNLTVDAGLASPTTWAGTYAIQAYNTTATLNNVTATKGNGGILVNNSTVTLTGAINVSGNGFGGIESSGASASLNVSGVSWTNSSEAYGLPTVWEDGTRGTTVINYGALTRITKGGQYQYYLTATNGTTINVPANYSTISAAIAAANSGDTINVAAGTYTENLTVNKSLTIQGVGDTTIINGGVDANGANVTIQNLKITNSNSETFYYGVRASANNALTLENITIDVLYYGVRMRSNDPSTSAVININNSRIKGYATIFLNGSSDALAVVNTGTVINVFNTSLIGTTSYDNSGGNDFAVVALAYTSGVFVNFTGTSSVANEFTGGAQAKENLILFYFNADNNSVTGTPTYTNAVNSTTNAVELFESAYGPYTNTVQGQVVARYVSDTTEFQAALASVATTPIVVGRGDAAITTTVDNTLKTGVTLLIDANNTPTTIATGTTLVNNGTIIIESGATFTNDGIIRGTGTISGTVGGTGTIEADLTAYNTALSAVTEATYTPTSWATYQLVVAANVMTVANTQAQVTTATSNITTAQASLVTVVDANLTSAKTAEALLTSTDYVSYTSVTSALALSETNNTEKITKTSAINSAISGLVTVASVFSTISTAVTSLGVVNNLNTVNGSNWKSFLNLSFEKRTNVADPATALGRITFTSALDLSDSATQTFLQDLGNKMQQSSGHIALNIQTATAFANKGATLVMYNLASGLTSGKLVVRDDAGTILDPATVVSGFSQDPTTNDVTFTAAHFTQFDIDSTAPTAPGTPFSSPNPTNQTTQTWNWTAATETLSGIAQYAWRAVLGVTTVSGTTTTNSTSTSLLEGIWNFFVKATDNAGNTGEESPSASLTVDTTAPATTDNTDSSWHNTDVSVTLNCNDASSGCATTYYTTDGSTPTTSSTTGNTVTLTTIGIYTIKYFSKDVAGNEEIVKTAANTVKVDKANPSGSITAPGNNSYKKTNPPYTATATDTNSGVASVKFQYKAVSAGSYTDLNTDTTSGYAASWSGVTLVTNTVYNLQIVITDIATNQTTINGVSFTFDNSVPVISYNYPTAGGQTIWYNADPGSVIDVDFLWGGGSPLSMAQRKIGTAAFTSIFTADRSSDYTNNWGLTWANLAEGLNEITIKVQDLAGNIRTDVSGFLFRKDTVKPVTADSGTDTNWHNTDVSVTLNCSDATSLCAPTYYTTDGSTPTTSSATGNTVTLTSDGVYTIKYFSVDNAGNQESVKTATNTVKIDKTDPTTSSGNSSASWRTSNITITLSAADLGGSALNNVRYNWDSTANATTGTVFTDGATITIPSEGNHTLNLYADDAAGNSATSTGTYKLDTSNPTVSATGASSSWQNSVPTITVSAADSVSGLASVQYGWDSDPVTTATSNTADLASTYPGDGTHTLNLLVTDNAGQTNTFTGEYDVDRVNPSTAGTPSTTTPTNNETDQTWSWAAAEDAISGIQNYFYQITGSATVASTAIGNVTSFVTHLGQGIYNFLISAQDNAGNESGEVAGAVTIDTTTPSLTSVSISSSNSTSTLAKVSDNIALTFTASEALQATPSATIAGHSVTPTNTSGNNWSASYTMASGDSEGVIPFSISTYPDLAGNSGSAISTTTDSSSITFDKTAPETPTVSPTAGSYSATQSVGLTSSGSSVIRYSTSGTPANCTSGTAYSTPISISTSTTLFTLACDSAGNTSSASFAYTIGSSNLTSPSENTGQVSTSTIVVLNNNANLDVSDGTNSATGGNITVDGTVHALNNFSNNDLVGTNLSVAQSVGGSSVVVDQAVMLGSTGDITLSNSDLSSVNVVIPNNTTVLAPSGWNGEISPPRTGSSSGSTPSGFSVGSTVIEVGSSLGILLFDQPVIITLTGVTGEVGYKPAGSSTWTQITNVCSGTYANPGKPTFPGECAINNGTDTKIVTYHFTSFAGLNTVTSSSSSSSSTGNDGGDGLGCAVKDCSTHPTIQNSVSAVSASGVLGLSSENQENVQENVGVGEEKGQVQGEATTSAQEVSSPTPQTQTAQAQSPFNIKVIAIIVILILGGFGLFRFFVK